ncbi:MAG: hypothetical protein M1816_001161 [Peltula sp. TS41687]|nr:MAG: hypothetical protein M1816_001161 [Peltula sp. TS41687]
MMNLMQAEKLRLDSCMAIMNLLLQDIKMRLIWFDSDDPATTGVGNWRFKIAEVAFECLMEDWENDVDGYHKAGDVLCQAATEDLRKDQRRYGAEAETDSQQTRHFMQKWRNWAWLYARKLTTNLEWEHGWDAWSNEIQS